MGTSDHVNSRVTFDRVLPNFLLHMRAPHLLQGNLILGHVRYDDVTSGEKTPLGRILHKFRLRIRAAFQGNTVVFLVHDVIKHFPFSVLFQTTTFEISVTCFSSTWRYKTFIRSFFPYFFKPQRLKYQLLAFLVNDVIKHFPVFFQTATFEISQYMTL